MIYFVWSVMVLGALLMFLANVLIFILVVGIIVDLFKGDKDGR